jgi:hypothetical protein
MPLYELEPYAEMNIHLLSDRAGVKSREVSQVARVEKRVRKILGYKQARKRCIRNERLGG